MKLLKLKFMAIVGLIFILNLTAYATSDLSKSKKTIADTLKEKIIKEGAALAHLRTAYQTAKQATNTNDSGSKEKLEELEKQIDNEESRLVKLHTAYQRAIQAYNNFK